MFFFLYSCSQTGPIEVVYELLLRGARVSAKGRRGQTAIECAKRRPEVTLLLNAAANAPGGGGGRRLALPPLPPPTPQASLPSAHSSGSSSTKALPPPPLAGIPDPMAQLSDSNSSSPPPISLIESTASDAPSPHTPPAATATHATAPAPPPATAPGGKVAKTARAPPALPHGLSWDNPPPPTGGSSSALALPAPPTKPAPSSTSSAPSASIATRSDMGTTITHDDGSSIHVLNTKGQGKETVALTSLIATLQAYQNMGGYPLPPELASLTPATLMKMGASGSLAHHIMSMVNSPQSSSPAFIASSVMKNAATVITLPSPSSASSSMQPHDSLGPCSLQPGWIFGDFKCQDTFTGGSKVADIDKVRPLMHVFLIPSHHTLSS